MKRILTAPDPLAALDACLEEMADFCRKEPQRRAFLLVPEALKADSERRYVERYAEHGLLLAEVLSLRRFAYRLFAEAGGLAVDRLDEEGRALLISHLLIREREQYPCLGRFAGKAAYAAELSQILGDFSRYQFPAEALQKAAEEEKEGLSRAKFADLARLSRCFQEAKRERGLYDADEDFPRLLQRLSMDPLPERLAFLRESPVWVAGFGLLRAFTPQELRLLEMLGKRCAGVTIALPGLPEPATAEAVGALQAAAASQKALSPHFPFHEQRPGSFTLPERRAIWLSEDRKEAIEALVGEILCLLKKGEPGKPPLRRREIAIAVSREEDLDPLLAALSREGADPFVSLPRPPQESPLYRYLDLFFRLAREEAHISDLFALARTGLLLDFAEGTAGNSAERISRYRLAELENLLRQTPARYAREIERPAIYRYLPRGETVRSSLLRCFAPVLEAARQLRVARTALHKWQVLAEWLESSGVRERLQVLIDRQMMAADAESARAQLLADSWRSLSHLLLNGQALLGEAPIVIRDFAALVLAGLARGTTAGIPLGVDRIRIGSPEQLLLYPCRYLFVLGAERSAFPAPLPAEGLLRNRERVRLEEHSAIHLPNYQRDGVRQSRALLYLLLRRPSEGLILISTQKNPQGIARSVLRALCGADARGNTKTPRELLLTAPRWGELLHRPGDADDAELAENAMGAGEREGTGERSEKQVVPPLAFCAAELQLPPAVAACRQEMKEISVSRLSLFQSCPYRYFAQVDLDLRERAVFTPASNLRGSFLHAMMEGAMEDLAAAIRAVGSDPLSLAASPGLREHLFQAWMSSCKKDELRALYARISAGPSFSAYRDGSVRGGEGHRLRLAALQVLEDSLQTFREEGFLPLAWEERFPAADFPAPLFLWRGQALPLHGIIDRIDISPAAAGPGRAFRIIDYKSSQRRFSPDAVLAGQELQLPLYAEAWQKRCPEDQLDALALHFLKREPGKILEDRAERQRVREGTPGKGAGSAVQRQTKAEELELLPRFAHSVAQGILDGMASGTIAARPQQSPSGSSSAGDLPCVHCPARELCAYDPRLQAGRVRPAPQLAVARGEGEGRDKAAAIRQWLREHDPQTDQGKGKA